MTKPFSIEHNRYGKSRLLYVSPHAEPIPPIEIEAFYAQRIESLNQSINHQGEVNTVILHPLLEQSSQNVFTNFMSAIIFAWENNLPASFLNEHSKSKIKTLLQSQKKENGIWSFFSRQDYFPDWDDTAIARKCFPSQAFDATFLLDCYSNHKLVETWIGKAPDSYLEGDIDLCVNLNILDYLFAQNLIEVIPQQIQDWCQKVLNNNGHSYFSIYYQSIPFLAYQLSKLFYYYNQQECCSDLFNVLKKYLAKETLIHNNFLSYIFTQNAKVYCQQKTEPKKDIANMYSFLQINGYYNPSPFFYGPEGWYGSSALNDLLVLEYFSLTNNANS